MAVSLRVLAPADLTVVLYAAVGVDEILTRIDAATPAPPT